MADYHTVYKGLPGETTQWEDIHRKLGNLPPKPPVWKPEAYQAEQEETKDAAWLESKDVEELSDLEDEFVDDRFLEEYRRKRISELQHAVLRPRFGTVEEIRAAEFVQKVTDASRGSSSPAAVSGRGDAAAAGTSTNDTSGVDTSLEDSSQQQGLWVVVQLYKDGHGSSGLMSKCIDELAERFPLTKFVRIVSTDCIPKYPDSNLPTLLVYHGGRCVKHLVGLEMFGGQRATPEQVALVLNRLGNVCSSATEDDTEEMQKEDMRLVRQLVNRVVADREAGDESSDFDD